MNIQRHLWANHVGLSNEFHLCLHYAIQPAFLETLLGCQQETLVQVESEIKRYLKSINFVVLW